MGNSIIYASWKGFPFCGYVKLFTSSSWVVSRSKLTYSNRSRHNLEFKLPLNYQKFISRKVHVSFNLTKSSCSWRKTESNPKSDIPFAQSIQKPCLKSEKIWRLAINKNIFDTFTSTIITINRSNLTRPDFPYKRYLHAPDRLAGYRD